MSNRYVLVTGGAGYIGSHTCRALANRGYTPVTFDNLSTGNLSAVKWGPFIVGDLLNLIDIKKVFAQYRFEGVIHFAAKAYVGESVKDPIKYFQGNVSTTINLLQAIQESEITAIVFSSSCAIYGEPDLHRISESTPQLPINPYGITKHICELLIKTSAQASALNFAILRYFNAAGANQEGEIGELHNPETHLIPLALQAALTDTEFNVFGGDFETIDGSAVRDYIHVDDLALAHVQALEKIQREKKSITCNLGTGQGHSVLQIMSQIHRIFPGFKYSIKERRVGDPAKLIADPTQAKKILNFSPRQSDLENIIKTALEWETSVKHAH
jgi:UDP-arabinose 4-epimerase